MGGEIGVEQRAGGGSVFWFRVPFSSDAAATAGPARPARGPDGAARARGGRQRHQPQRSCSRQAHLLGDANATAAEEASEALEMLRTAAAAGRPYDVARPRPDRCRAWTASSSLRAISAEPGPARASASSCSTSSGSRAAASRGRRRYRRAGSRSRLASRSSTTRWPTTCSQRPSADRGSTRPRTPTPRAEKTHPARIARCSWSRTTPVNQSVAAAHARRVRAIARDVAAERARGAWRRSPARRYDRRADGLPDARDGRLRGHGGRSARRERGRRRTSRSSR